MGDTADDTYENFMRVCDQFKLGELVTESPNPITANLSQDCQRDMAAGLESLQEADRAAMKTLVEAWDQRGVAELTERLARDVHATFEAGKRVFLVGCGATGRLSLSLEVFAREGMLAEKYRDSVRGFMAGGDVALIRSIEKFEDREPYGQQQLRDLGYADGDLIVAITEGGETPFVIAACEEGVRLSPDRQHYFLYCNPDETLCRLAERSKRVIENDKIVKINLTHGPMAVTGSTRMQATTVQILVAGLAIQYHDATEKIRPALSRVADCLSREIRFADLAPFTEAEAKLYRDGQFFVYQTDYFTCTVMTDTTERSPTFSFPPFENFDFKPHPPPSPVYLNLPGLASSKEAWARLLHREPRGIAWPETREQTATDIIYGYDFSERGVAEREARYGADKTAFRLSVNKTATGVEFALRDTRDGASASPQVRVEVKLERDILEDPLLVNVVVKAILNAHSTAIMARNGRLQGNVMVYVKPTNNKLIDRSTRYITLILKQNNRLRIENEQPEIPIPSYAEIVKMIYDVRPTLAPTQPVVLEVVRQIEERTAASATA